MNKVTIKTEAEKKSTVLKSLAILGLIFILSFIAWLSVQIFAIAPGAFSSLASLASSLSDARDEVVEEMNEAEVLIIESNAQSITTGDEIILAWSKTEAVGSYTFNYACATGVSVEIVGVDGFRNIACDTNYNIGDVQNLSLNITSTETRYVEIPYTISFLKTNDTRASLIGTNKVTVTNLDIADPNQPTEEVLGEADTSSEVVAEDEVTPSVTPPPVVTEVEYVYEIPVSNPNGIADLTARYLNIGEIRNNRFIAGEVTREETGAIQFEVRNIGNKTSETWRFTVELPDGSDYQSNLQAPIRPNERATLVLGFEAGGGSSFTFTVEVESEDERTENNNSFRQTVSFK